MSLIIFHLRIDLEKVNLVVVINQIGISLLQVIDHVHLIILYYIYKFNLLVLKYQASIVFFLFKIFILGSSFLFSLRVEGSAMFIYFRYLLVKNCGSKEIIDLFYENRMFFISSKLVLSDSSSPFFRKSQSFSLFSFSFKVLLRIENCFFLS